MNKELQKEQQRDEEEALETERLKLERQLKQVRPLPGCTRAHVCVSWARAQASPRRRVLWYIL